MNRPGISKKVARCGGGATKGRREGPTEVIGEPSRDLSVRQSLDCHFRQR